LLLLQEIKCEEHQFPALAFQSLGYQSASSARNPITASPSCTAARWRSPARKLPGMTKPTPMPATSKSTTDNLTIGNLYLPNGNSGGDAGYAYKLEWMAALRAHAAAAARR
jgi:exodeoxyribonuclease-3